MKSLEHLGRLIDGVSQTLKYEIKKQEGGFPGILLGTLGASVLGNMLTRKGVLRAEKGVLRARRGYNNMDQIF